MICHAARIKYESVYKQRREDLGKKIGDDVLSNSLKRHVMCSTGELEWSFVMSLGNVIRLALMS